MRIEMYRHWAFLLYFSHTYQNSARTLCNGMENAPGGQQGQMRSHTYHAILASLFCPSRPPQTLSCTARCSYTSTSRALPRCAEVPLCACCHHARPECPSGMAGMVGPRRGWGRWGAPCATGGGNSGAPSYAPPGGPSGGPSPMWW